MELRDYVRILRKRWLAIVAAVLLGVAVAAAATLVSTPRYEANTLVYVQVQSSGSIGDLAQGSSFVQSQVASFAEVVSTPRVLDAAIKTLNLSESADALAADVIASAPLETVNIRITVTRDSPGEAAQIANAVTASFRQVVGEITESSGANPTSQVSVSVLRDASEPTAPISPDTRLNLILGMLVGLALGLTFAILREVLDTRIRGERDVAAITSAPIVGGIGFDPRAVQKPLIVQEDPHSVRAEAFRTLRTNLQFLDVESGARSFVITSSIPSEGKTTTAANLAIALADSGAQVVLIDGDLRRPKIASYMGLEGAVGLTDVLISRVELADALQAWGRGNLVVLPAGAIPPNPSELLGSKAMSSIIRTLESEFDVVIIDLPPLLPVTDAALVSKLTSGALVVVAAGRTHKGEFAGAIAALENVGASVAGVIMTMMPTKGPDAYGYGGYGYGYGYSSQTPESSTVVPDGPEQPRKRLSPEWGNAEMPGADVKPV
ncbi:capsular exopolysaccharide synthesis family protein [Glaciihabitans tibetensis]|uniref:non-specific protein-tyrosine kinase n=1 Tax=Glaciihabitans tibetensis TaxID=1266600 RepID=A0A2T0V3B1_9MICO|nr:polysaccharide biosynthesis tyrosine autokinase [Glaciihabitans tibetensis]PRY64665.1 capsular exopolysaccharide synthesis family protein [Glaciihabitans tibetensis]